MKISNSALILTLICFTLPQTAFAELRTRPEITSAFSISSSGRLWPFLNREILNPPRPTSGFAQSITTKSNLNLSGYHRNLFPDESLGRAHRNCKEN